MPAYDLTGLFLRSKAVVLAERLGPGGGATRFRVKKAYLGPLLPGDEFTIDIRGYLQGYLFGLEQETIDAENILFLEETEPASIVRSGIKVLSGGTVYGLTFESGEFYLTGQSLEPMTLAMHEAELRRAIARVEAFRAVLEIKDAKLKERKLLELLGPARPRPVLLRDYDRHGLDDLEVRILRTLYKHSDLRLTLEGLARTRPRELAFLPEEVLDEGALSRLLPAATSRDLPADLREAATLALRNCSWSSNEEAALQAAMWGFLQDPLPEVRRAALVNLAQNLHNLNARGEHPEAIQAILAAGRAETEPLTRLLFLEVAGRFEISELPRALSQESPIALLAAFHEKKAYAAWASYEEPATRIVEAIFTAVAAPRGGGVERRSRPTKEPRSYDLWGSLPLEFDPPIEAGDYDLRVEGRFRFKEKPDVTAVSPPVAVRVPSAAAANAPDAAPKR